MNPELAEYVPQLQQGVRLFNEGEFFACHDVLEEAWTDMVSDDRLFFQGLIHAAVCLFHFEGDNLTGARKMYGSARRYLTPFEPHFMRIDVGRLLADLRCCFAELAAHQGTYPAHIRLDAALVPQIHWQPEPSE